MNQIKELAIERISELEVILKAMKTTDSEYEFVLNIQKLNKAILEYKKKLIQ